MSPPGLPGLAAAQPLFAQLPRLLQGYVDAQILPGASAAVVVDGEVVHRSCVGWADRERGIALHEDHIFRVFSNTKLVTACAVMLLVEEGRLRLDAPAAAHLPALAQMRVLRSDGGGTEALRTPISVRHLLTHTAGLGYTRSGDGPLGDAHNAGALLLDVNETLEQFVQRLPEVPLRFQPGSAWEYSVCSDVLARLVEVVSGQDFDVFLRERIFQPLAMHSTGFFVAPRDQARLVRFYRSLHADDPFRGGLQASDALPYPDAYRQRPRLCSGGAGLVSTLGDMTALLRSLVSPRHALLRPDTIALMLRDQLQGDRVISFGRSSAGRRGYSLCGAVTRKLTPLDPPGAEGEVQWGGIAGTHWWVSPATRSAAVIMTQRHLGFWHLFAFQARRQIYAAVNACHQGRAAADLHAA